MSFNIKGTDELEIKRGTIVKYNFKPKDGSSVQAGIRPALVISNDIGNAHSTIVMIAAITSKIKKMKMPTHIIVNNDEDNNCGLTERSMCMLEQITTIDKTEIVSVVGSVSQSVMTDIDKAIAISFGLHKRKYVQGKYANVVCLCDECQEFIKSDGDLIFRRVDPFDKTSNLCQRHNKRGYMYFLYPKNLMER